MGPSSRCGNWESTLDAPACKSQVMRVGVIGGTGPAGRAVSSQLAAVGLEVVVGSRSHERATDAVDELKERWKARSLNLAPGENRDAARADLVVIATPWEGILSTVHELAADLSGKTVVSMASALTRWDRALIPLLPPTGSVTAALAAALPGSHVVGAFHHMPAGPWSDLDNPMEADVLVCGENREAKDDAIELIDCLPGLRGVDAGGLGSALAIEALTPCLLEVNRRYKAHVAVRLTGLPR